MSPQLVQTFAVVDSEFNEMRQITSENQETDFRYTENSCS